MEKFWSWKTTRVPSTSLVRKPTEISMPLFPQKLLPTFAAVCHTDVSHHYTYSILCLMDYLLYASLVRHKADFS